MKQLTESDLEKMAAGEFAPDEHAINRSVRAKLKLGQLIPEPATIAPDVARLDLHNHTIEQSWEKLNNLVISGTRRATIITGASGVLKTKFTEWVTHSTLAPNIISCRALNNGSFEIQIRKK